MAGHTHAHSGLSPAHTSRMADADVEIFKYTMGDGVVFVGTMNLKV